MRGMTQKQVGDKCGMPDSAVRKYERGVIVPKYDTLERISFAISVSFRFLLGAAPFNDMTLLHQMKGVILANLNKRGLIVIGNKILDDISRYEYYELVDTHIASIEHDEKHGRLNIEFKNQYLTDIEKLQETKKEIDDFIEYEERQLTPERLTSFSSKYPKFISFLTSIGWEVELNENNEVLMTDTDDKSLTWTNSYWYSIDALDYLRRSIEDKIYHDITNEWSERYPKSDDDESPNNDDNVDV